MSETVLFTYLCKLREELFAASAKVTGEATLQQLYYRTQYIEKLGIYHHTLQLMLQDTDNQIHRVSDQIKMVKASLEER